MKKVLSVLSLMAIIGMFTPAFAAPPPPSGGQGPHGGGHRVYAGAHHRPHMAPRHHHHHGGVRVYSSYPRHSYWYGYRSGYWGNPWCNYRLGCYPPPGVGVYVPMGGASFSVRF